MTVARRALTRTLPVALALVLGAFIGWWMADAPAPADPPEAPGAHAHDAGETDPGAEATPEMWTCSMHPQVQLPEPGLCPLCSMALVPAGARSGDGPPRVALSPAANARAGLRTVPVERRAIVRAIALTGEVTYDETRVERASAWFGGRIETMYVDSVGQVVDKGDRLFTIYSPDLLLAQREYLQARRGATGAPTGPIGDAARRALEAAEERLRLWGLSSWQIRQLDKTGKPSRTVTVHAPRGGTVTERARLAGSYVDEGTVVYTIADLSRVWVELRAYERDLPFLSEGLRADFTVDTVPGVRFEGTITYISPTIDRATRTATVRLEVPNPDGRLRPGAWARGRVHATLPADPDAPTPLVVPESAPLVVGDRAVVFVALEGAEEPTYLLREVTLGARGEGMQIVTEGLMAGEQVVAEGAFKLDSVLQIRGDRSLMSTPPASPPAEAAADLPANPSARLALAVEELGLDAIPDGARAPLGATTAAAVALSAALADDDLDATVAARDAAVPALRALADALRDTPEGPRLSDAAAALSTSPAALAPIREAWVAVNDVLVPLVVLAAPSDAGAQVTYCPMVLGDRGAYWLQAPGDVRNPYYGAEMLACGVAVGRAVPSQAPEVAP